MIIIKAKTAHSNAGMSRSQFWCQSRPDVMTKIKSKSCQLLRHTSFGVKSGVGSGFDFFARQHLGPKKRIKRDRLSTSAVFGHVEDCSRHACKEETEKKVRKLEADGGS